MIQPTTTTTAPEQQGCPHTSFSSQVKVDKEKSDDGRFVRWVAVLQTKCSQCGVQFNFGPSLTFGPHNIAIQIVPGEQ